MYIYKLTNKKNGKSYIGQSCRNPEVRWEEHVKNSYSSDPKQRKYLQNAINKYGWDNFDKEIIEVNDITKGQSFLDEREFYWVLEHKTFYKWGNGYNLTLGGSGTKGGGSCRREKLKSKTGQTDTYDYANYDIKTGKLVNVYLTAREGAKGVGGMRYEHVNAAANWLIGKGKFAKTYKGYIWMKLPNDETFPKKIDLKKWESQVRLPTLKRQPKSDKVLKDNSLYEIAQYNLLGELVKVWPNNMSLIEREFKTFFPDENVQYNSIVNNIRGKNFTAGGYFWKRNEIGMSPKTTPVMSEYKGYEFRKELFNNEPIVSMVNDEITGEYDSIFSIPSNIATSFDKINIYKSANENKKYKNTKWLFTKNL